MCAVDLSSKFYLWISRTLWLFEQNTSWLIFLLQKSPLLVIAMFTKSFGFHLLSLYKPGEQAFIFAVFHDLEKLVQHLTCILYHLGDTPNVFDLFITSKCEVTQIAVYREILPKNFPNNFQRQFISRFWSHRRHMYIPPLQYNWYLPLPSSTGLDLPLPAGTRHCLHCSITLSWFFFFIFF